MSRLEKLKEGVKSVIGGAIPGEQVDIDKEKQEVIAELAELRWRYEDDPLRQRAFREVLTEFATLISEGKWSLVYQILYRAKE